MVYYIVNTNTLAVMIDFQYSDREHLLRPGESVSYEDQEDEPSPQTKELADYGFVKITEGYEYDLAFSNEKVDWLREGF